MEQNVVRFADYEHRSLNPDACSPRNPSDAATIIVLPIIRIEREHSHPSGLTPICA